MFLKNKLMKFLATSSVAASGLNGLSANAILEFSEKTEDRSPYSFLSDDEYSKIRDFDEIKDLIEKCIGYGATDFYNISSSNPLNFTVENRKFKYTAFLEQKRGFRNFVIKDIFAESKEVPYESYYLSDLSKDERKKLIGDLKKKLKDQIILKIEETIKNYKNKKIIHDDKNSFECLFTISLSDVDKIIKMNNASLPGTNAGFYCPISIKIDKEYGRPKNLVITSVNKLSRQGILDDNSTFISVKTIDLFENFDINSTTKLEKYLLDISLVFKNYHDSFKKDVNIQSIEDVRYGPKKGTSRFSFYKKI